MVQIRTPSSCASKFRNSAGTCPARARKKRHEDFRATLPRPVCWTLPIVRKPLPALLNRRFWRGSSQNCVAALNSHVAAGDRIGAAHGLLKGLAPTLQAEDSTVACGIRESVRDQ